VGGSNRQNGKGINGLRWEKMTMRKEYGAWAFDICMVSIWQCYGSKVGD